MRQSRSERLARSKRKRVRRYRQYWLLGTASLMVLLSAAYFIWFQEWPGYSKGIMDSGNEQSGGDEVDATEPDKVEPREPEHSEPAPANEPQPTETAKVSFAFVGDMMLGGRIDDLLKKKGFDYPYLYVHGLLKEVDFAAGNLENPITDRGEAAEKSYTFRMSPEAVPALKESGLDVVNLANNHTLDYGLIGLRDTIQYLNEAGLGHTGAGENEGEAFQAYLAEQNGVKVAFLGFTNVVPDVSWKADKHHPGVAETYNYTRAVQAIERSAAEADIVVVIVHWGKERVEIPEPYMTDNAHRYIDAGADIVIGSHPHVLQGIESYKGKWIAYSLGNFIFTVNPSATSRDSAILRADCNRSGLCDLSVLPMLTGIGQPVLAADDEAAAILKKLDRLSIGASVNEFGKVSMVPTKQGDGKQSNEKQSDGKHSDEKQSNGKQSDGMQGGAER